MSGEKPAGKPTRGSYQHHQALALSNCAQVHYRAALGISRSVKAGEPADALRLNRAWLLQAETFELSERLRGEPKGTHVSRCGPQVFAANALGTKVGGNRRFLLRSRRRLLRELAKTSRMLCPALPIMRTRTM
jgi:hypothetical protein